jgi:hypothetical protein
MTDDTFTIDPNDPPRTQTAHLGATWHNQNSRREKSSKTTPAGIDGTPLTDAEARHIVNAIRKGDR